MASGRGNLTLDETKTTKEPHMKSASVNGLKNGHTNGFKQNGKNGKHDNVSIVSNVSSVYNLV